MTRIVLDCSMTMSWCFEDEADQESDRVLDVLSDAEALVPSIWALEVANVLLVAERRSRLSPAESSRFLELVGALPILVEDVPFDRATSQVLAVARSTGLSAYDASYLELAMRTDSPLATRDDRLKTACRATGVELC
jgi:predicted nucleic acid-binding protein